MAIIINPNFDASPSRLAQCRAMLNADTTPLPRPLVILGGWRAWSISPLSARRVLAPLLPAGTPTVPVIAYPFSGSFEHAGRVVRDRLARANLLTTPIDIVAISMGGLLARWLALRGELSIARLFTLATPHRGAHLARFIAPDKAARAMREGSPLLHELDAALPQATYTLTCYAALRDWWVHARNTSPPGLHPYWVDPTTILGRLFSHFAINANAAIHTDIALRLRGLPPLAVEPSQPPIN